MSFKVLGTGSFLPPRIVSNEDLSAFLDTTDEWIMRRVGVRTRYVCTTETTADLACIAAERALENGGVSPAELDFIICATVSADDASPAVACMVQKHIGADCPAMDVNSACSGFIFALETAAGFFAMKKAKKILVIGAERMSRILDWTDRSTCIIFGDGAGAVLLGEGDSYIASRLVTKGGDDVIKIPNFPGTSPFFRGEAQKPYVLMDGPKTFKYAVNTMSGDLTAVMEDAGIKGEELAFVIPHQANARIIRAAAKRAGIPEERFFVNIEKYGNTSAASIPIALDELNRAGGLKPGDCLALCAYGGGLSSAACILKW